MRGTRNIKHGESTAGGIESLLETMGFWHLGVTDVSNMCGIEI